SAAADRTIGIICDQTIALDGHYTTQHYPEHLRRIRFRDAETGKKLVFLTNQFGLPAATICALYKSRWQVELFFKWIKQHLRIKRFYGTSENAVRTQNLDRHQRLRAGGDHQEETSSERVPAYAATDLVADALRE